MSRFDEMAKDWDNDPVKINRAKSVGEAIRKNVNLTKDMSGLEFGCGTGLLSFNLLPYLKKITLVDNSVGMMEVLQQKIEQSGLDNMFPLCTDLLEEDLPAEKFDIIYTLMTLHHILDTRKILQILHSMLNPSGYICIADLDEEDGSFHGEGFDGHNGFNRDEFCALLEEIGFTVTHNDFCFEMHKNDRVYPIFLIVGQKKA